MFDMTCLYKELFQAVNFDKNGGIVSYRYNKEDVTLNDLAHFVSMKGELYDTSDVRLLVVGRATNGWPSLTCESAQEFAEAANRKFNSIGFLQLVSNPEARFNELHNDPGSSDERYYLCKSPFWRVTYGIWRGLTGSDKDQFLKHIAWSNLYKIAPSKVPPNKNGNPTTAMCKKQFKACKEILRAEIQAYRPTHILLVTDYDRWFAHKDYDFSGLFEDRKRLGSNYENKTIFVEGTAKYKLADGKSIPTVITCRPEKRNEDAFNKAALEAFSSLQKKG